MANASLRLVTHPLAVISHIVCETLYSGATSTFLCCPGNDNARPLPNILASRQPLKLGAKVEFKAVKNRFSLSSTPM